MIMRSIAVDPGSNPGVPIIMGLWSAWNKSDKSQILRKYAPIFEFVFILSIVIADLICPSQIIITWQLVTLVALMIVTPYIPLIKKISYGDWEAELDTLVQEAEKTVKSPQSTDQRSDVNQRIENLEEMLIRQIEDDPKVGLAKLRIEIDDVLRKFAATRGLFTGEKGKNFSAILHFLKNNTEVMDSALYSDIDQVRTVATKAIHGEEVNKSTAERIIKVGLRVLERIYNEVERSIDPDPSKPAFSIKE